MDGPGSLSKPKPKVLRILQTLLNAVKYTQRGGVSVTWGPTKRATPTLDILGSRYRSWHRRSPRRATGAELHEATGFRRSQRSEQRPAARHGPSRDAPFRMSSLPPMQHRVRELVFPSSKGFVSCSTPAFESETGPTEDRHFASCLAVMVIRRAEERRSPRIAEHRCAEAPEEILVLIAMLPKCWRMLHRYLLYTPDHRRDRRARAFHLLSNTCALAAASILRRQSLKGCELAATDHGSSSLSNAGSKFLPELDDIAAESVCARWHRRAAGGLDGFSIS